MRGYVLPRLSIIFSSSLARHNILYEPTVLNRTEACSNPCAELQASVNHGMVLMPLGIALLFFVMAALPVVLFRSRYRVYGVRSCLWVLIELWVQLILTHVLFTVDKAQAYVWALHASAHILSHWQPKKGMPYPGLQTVASMAGVWCVGLFAWQWGPPVGLAAWQSKSDAQCGWKVHLTSVVGVEVVSLIFWPLEAFVVGFN